MNVTELFTVSFLRVYFQGPITHWGIQCIDFDRPVDVHAPVSFNQTYPLPRLVCISSHRRCYASDEAHAIVAETVTVAARRIPLRTWPSVDTIPGDGQWPFCFAGGGAKYGGANVTATCGIHGDCLDTCFAEEDTTPPAFVWCKNATVQVPVKWDDGTRNVGWTPWADGHPRDDHADVIEVDSPMVINRASGASVIARHGSHLIVQRDDGVCLAPPRWLDGTCHVIVHGICYAYDRKASVHCIDLIPFPPGAVVALTWRPHLLKSLVQPLEPATTDLFCLESSDHDPEKFVSCLQRFSRLARTGISSLSPFAVMGRPSTVLIRVAPAKRYNGERELEVAQWLSIIVSIALGVVIWTVMTIAALCASSQLHLLEHRILRVSRELQLSY